MRSDWSRVAFRRTAAREYCAFGRVGTRLSRPVNTTEKRMDRSAGVYDLARVNGVTMTEACRRAGVAPSTPARWRRGSRPRAPQVAALRKSIVELAAERGTYVERLDATVSDLLEQARGLLDRAQALVDGTAGARR